jgi:heat shock protein HtpX
MWELIRANRRKSLFLFIILGGILLFTGFVLGKAYIPDGGGATGLFLALCIWAIWSVVSFFKGDSMLLAFSRAKEVDHNVHPQLYNVVEEMKIAANLPAMPKIYIINEEAPNAFATGRKPEKSAIAVTAGLLNRLNRNELQGVIAHEISHILNRDILYMTFAGIMLGTIALLSEVFLRGLWFGGGSSRRFRSSRKSDSGGGAIMIIALALAILAPLLSRIFYFTINRKREYLADASAARLTRYPEGLASALEKISSAGTRLSRANSITAPMYIVNPLKTTKKAVAGLFSTHPPVQKRIQILRNMTHGVNYVNYQNAFRMVTGKGIIPSSELKDTKNIDLKKPAPEPGSPPSQKEKKRELGDLMRVVNGFIFLVCVCGLRIKIPPKFKKSRVACPRCKRNIPVPLKKLATLAAVAGAGAVGKKDIFDQQPASKDFQQYQRKSQSWETVPCSCGNHIQLSPAFESPEIQCGHCKKQIKIIPLSR